ncbi:hypothetical protein K2X96_03660 [Patescibacteria group bacterium]|nr:hypothetical protein [Patescibacteria group bacterium]
MKVPKNLTKTDVAKIIKLRESGHSLPEIRKITGRSNDAVFKYIKGVKVNPAFAQILKEKQGGSKVRALKNWELARKEAEQLITTPLNKKEKLLILACLYWGEGTKQELNIINSDGNLLKVVVSCLKDLGIQDSEFRITLRLYGDCDVDKARIYWSNILNLPANSIKNINILTGKKEGKLMYGMCRIRVTKAARYFKLIISIINLIKAEIT